MNDGKIGTIIVTEQYLLKRKTDEPSLKIVTTHKRLLSHKNTLQFYFTSSIPTNGILDFI